jgi:hypothetical protein
MDRRTVLGVLGGSIALATAGCSGGDSDGNGNETNETGNGGNGDQAPAAFELSGLDPESAEVEVGAAITVTADVENTGEATGTTTVELSVGDTSIDSTEVELEGGASETVSFEGVDTGALGAGEFEHTVSAGDSGVSGSLTVLAPAEFAVSNLDPQSAEVEVGAAITVTANVENTGEATGTTTVELSAGGTSIDSTEVELEGGASETVSFEGVDTGALGAGEFEHTVSAGDGQVSGSLAVLAPAEFAVSNLDPQSAEIALGETLSSVSATVENVGDVSGTETVELLVGGNAVDSSEITLDGGSSETVTFSNVQTAGFEVGGFTHAIAAADSSVEGTLTLTEPSGVAFEVSNLDPQSATVGLSETLTVSATVENTRSTEVTETVNLDVGGSTVGSSEVTLGGGSSERVTFENVDASALGIGTYDHAVSVGSERVAGTLEVTGPIPDAFTAESEGGLLAIGENFESGAREEGIALPPSRQIRDPIVVEAETTEDGWQSARVDFPDLTPGIIRSNFDVPDLVTINSVSVSTPFGFSGEIDQQAGLITVRGEIRIDVVVNGNPFAISIEIDATTGESGRLTGDIDLSADPVTATVVDNEFDIPSTGESLIDNQVGLPSGSGRNWVEIEFQIEGT